MVITEDDSEKKRILNRVVNDMGGGVEEFIQDRNCYLVYLAGKKMLLEYHIAISRDPHVGIISTKCKDITHKLLVEASLPTPRSESFYSENFNKAEAYKRLDKMNYPIVLKHALGSNSCGLFVDIPNSKQAVKILKKNLENFKSMIAQKMIYGKEYRVLVLGDKIIGALEMVHPYVVGDGTSSLRNLIKTKQGTTDRRTKFDKRLKLFVKKQGFSLRDVIPKGKTVGFKGNCCLAEGGETRDVTSSVHKDVISIFTTTLTRVKQGMS